MSDDENESDYLRRVVLRAVRVIVIVIVRARAVAVHRAEPLQRGGGRVVAVVRV